MSFPPAEIYAHTFGLLISAREAVTHALRFIYFSRREMVCVCLWREFLERKVRGRDISSPKRSVYIYMYTDDVFLINFNVFVGVPQYTRC